MAKYQKYAEYKDSGEWLGEIPLHWDIQPTKRFFRLVAEPAPDNNDYELLSVYTEIGVKPRKELEQKGNKASTTDGYWLVKKGDIVVNKLLAWMGAVGYSEYDGVTSPAYDILRPTKKLNPKFYHYLFRTKIANMEFKRWSRGIMEMRLRLYFDELGRISMPFPTFEEQNQIVDFLDHETAQIDNLITKQEKLIELLKEKRQAVISHAVTKGLNPNVPMKDSGVEWLGDVPEHWDVCKIQYYAKIESGHTPSKTNEKYWENCTIPWVSLNDSKQLRVVDYITDTKYQISELGLANSSARILPKETVVFTRDASIGLSAITTREMAVSQHLIAWLPNKEKLSPEFLLLIFYAMEKEFNRYTFGSTIKTIGMDDVSSLMASFPPLAEQLEIVSRSFSQFELIDTSIEKSNCLLNILKERRTALISAAVTGKIDVRNWQNSNQKNEVNAELCA